MSDWYLYVLRCCDDTLYTGITTNIDQRLSSHNSGKGAKYTRSRLPVRLVYSEKLDSESSARKREIEIKSLKRNQKLELIDLFSEE